MSEQERKRFLMRWAVFIFSYFSCNEPGLGPLMRDVKNKICTGKRKIAFLSPFSLFFPCDWTTVDSLSNRFNRILSQRLTQSLYQ